jgi:sugar/nucleoside kinase (ribokinase family)
MSRLGQKVTLVGSIGKDFGSRFRASLEADAIEAVVSESAHTGGFALNYYDDKGNRTLDLLGRASNIDFLPPGLRKASAVLVGPILGETSFELIRKIRQTCEGIMMLDPQGLLRTTDGDSIVHFKPDGIEEIAGLFDIVKPNELECKVLTGIDPREDAEEAARLIYSWGPREVAITLAEQGSVVFAGRDFRRIPAYPADCVDATGAGDTYAAGYMYKKLGGGAPYECALWGTAVASVMIEHVGPNFPLSREIVLERTRTLMAAESVTA